MGVKMNHVEFKSPITKSIIITQFKIHPLSARFIPGITIFFIVCIFFLYRIWISIMIFSFYVKIQINNLHFFIYNSFISFKVFFV